MIYLKIPHKLSSEKSSEKNFKKTSEKGLTNEEKCGIINELSDKRQITKRHLEN